MVRFLLLFSFTLTHTHSILVCSPLISTFINLLRILYEFKSIYRISFGECAKQQHQTPITSSSLFYLVYHWLNSIMDRNTSVKRKKEKTDDCWFGVYVQLNWKEIRNESQIDGRNEMNKLATNWYSR